LGDEPSIWEVMQKQAEQFKEKEEDLKKRSDELNEKEKEVESKASSLESKESEIASKENEISSKESEIQEKASKLDEDRNAFDSEKNRIIELENGIKDRESQLGEKQKELASREEDILAKQEDIKKVEDEAAQKRQDMIAAEESSQAALSELKEVIEKLNAKGEEILNREKALAKEEEELNANKEKLIEDGKKLMENIKPTIGLLNPPYKTERFDPEELEYVLNNLLSIDKNGTCIAILPMRCAIAQKGASYELKKKLLDKHTLEAVMSMPEDLFHNSKVGTVTCIMVIKAHIPHNSSNKKTWLAYWRDDGFIKKKALGRIDYNNTWPEIKDRWVNAFINRETIQNFSLMRNVNADDEWCVEAYLETDYSKLDENEFKEYYKRYLTYKFLNTMEADNEKID